MDERGGTKGMQWGAEGGSVWRRGLKAENSVGGVKSGRDDERTCVSVPVWHERSGRGSLVWPEVEAALFGVTAPQCQLG